MTFKSYTSSCDLFNIISQYRTSNDPYCGMIDFLYYRILGIEPENDSEMLKHLEVGCSVSSIQTDYNKYYNFIEKDEIKSYEVCRFVEYARTTLSNEEVIKKINKYRYEKISNLFDSKIIIKKIFNFYKKEKQLKKLIVLIGETGSGKTTIEKELSYMFEKIVISTNKPKRIDEKNIKDNYFKTNEEIEKIINSKNALLVEKLETKEFYGFDKVYLIEKDEFKKLKEKDSIVILTPVWYLELLKKVENKEIDFDFEIIPYYISTKKEERIKISLNKNIGTENELKSKILEEEKTFKLIDNRSEIKKLINNFDKDSLNENVKKIFEDNYKIFNFKMEE